MRRLFVCLAAAALFQMTSIVAYSAPITSFAGFTGPISDVGGNVSFSGVSTVKLGTLTINFLAFPMTTLTGSDVLVNGQLSVSTFATPGLANGSPTTFSFNVPNTGKVTPFGTLNGGVVSFDLINPLEANGFGTTTTFGSLTDSTPEFVLKSNTSNLDFGPIGTQFHLQLSAQGISYSGGANGTFSSTGVPTGSFTANVVVAAIPEPSSIALLGGMLVGSGLVWIRKRRNA